MLSTTIVGMDSAPTSIRIPPELKKRIEASAAAADKSLHAYVLDVLEAASVRNEKRRAFVAAAVAARSDLTYPAEAVHEYFRRKRAGEKNPPRPKPTRRTAAKAAR